MADQKKSVAEIIEEMRRELRDEKGPDSDLFVSSLTRETREKLKGKPSKKKKAAKGKAAKKKKPAKKAKKKGKPAKKMRAKNKPVKAKKASKGKKKKKR